MVTMKTPVLLLEREGPGAVPGGRADPIGPGGASLPRFAKSARPSAHSRGRGTGLVRR
jgi:hypothetical protein